MTEPVLEIKGLSAFYGKAQALTDVSLTVGAGEIVGLIGANSAFRRATAMRMRR